MLWRYAGFIARHARSVLFGTAVAFIVFAFLGVQVFGKLESQGFNDPASGSSQAASLLASQFPGQPNLVLVASARDGQSAGATLVVRAGRDLVQRLSLLTGVSAVTSWWTTQAPEMRSRDGRQVLIAAHVSSSGARSADDNTKAIITALGDGTTVLNVAVGGSQGVNNDIGTQVGKDLAFAESLAVPITLVLLLIAFGSIVAAPLPLAIGVVAVFGAFAELFLMSQVTDVSIFAINLATALGLGLGIDYALLIVNRFREEMDAHDNITDALVRTVSTAGRTVIFSSLTVAVALSALLVFPLYFLRSFAYAGIGVVVIALLGALITLPAILAVLGPRVNSGRLRRSRPVRAASASSTFWRRLATAVMRRPAVFALPVVVLLIVAGLPFLHASFGIPDDRVLPTTAESRQVGDALRANFIGGPSTALTAVIDGRPTSTAVAAYARTVSQLPSVQRVNSSVGTMVSGQPADAAQASDARFVSANAQYLTVIGPPDTQSDASQQLVHDVRAVSPPPGTTSAVGGPAAELVDGNDAIGSHLWTAVAIIAISTFILLFLFTGSVLLPIKALVLNLLSLTGVFGAMVWIFQDGHGSTLLGFTPGVVNTSMPVLLFCIAFGLSMDYEVFLLSRIKEFHDNGSTNHDAVVSGLAHTGRIITTAAALLSVTFLAFVTSKVSFMQLFGLGTTIAIVVDATLIRGVLVPAFMSVAGDANWWAPGPLRRLHRRIGLAERVSRGGEL
jgi:RND superfamily putative drug exporter